MNLRKLLAVILVVALAVSLMATVSAANVSDYSDAEDVQYTEAVDLFSALGFLQGRDSGEFAPKDLVTREEAAKIVTYMLIGSTKAKALTVAATSFSDVTVDRWSAPYIEYCTASGIIQGSGDGTFDPVGNVTGSQFAKMLLCAIGYGVNDEYIGANWAMKTIADATRLGIISLDSDLSVPATREEISQYGFNAYTKCNTVVYNGTTSAYQQAAEIDGVTARGSLAKQQHVNNTTNTYIINGTSYYRWTKDGNDLTNGYTAEKILGTSTAGTTIADLSDSYNLKCIAPIAPAAEYYYNGQELVQAANLGIVDAGSVYYNSTTGAVVRDDGDGLAEALSQDIDVVTCGVIVNMISTNSDGYAEKVAVTKKEVTVLGGDPVINDDAGTVTIVSISGCANQPVDKVPGYADLKKGDIVLWYKDALGVFNVEKAKSVSGAVTQYVSGVNNGASTVTVGEMTYRYSGISGTIGHDAVETMAGLEDTTLYFDDGGFLVYAVRESEEKPASDYLFCIDQATAGFEAVAKVVLASGSTVVITVDSTGSPAAVNQFFRYAVTSTGAYYLTAITNDAKNAGSETTTGTFYNVYAGDPVQKVTITRKTVYFLEKAGVGTSNLSGNNKTVFLYQKTGTTVSAYTGLNSVPNYLCDLAAEKVYALYIDGAAIMVYGIGGTASSSAIVGDWVYIANSSPTVTVLGSITTYKYRAVVNGLLDWITVDSINDTATFNGTVGLYLVTEYDSNGYVTEANDTAGTPPAKTHYYGSLGGDTLQISGGNITANGTDWYVLYSDVHIYLIDSSTLVPPTNDITLSEPTDIVVNALDSIGATVDFVETSSDSAIAAVYIYV